MICILSLPLPERFALILTGVCRLLFGRTGADRTAMPVLMVLQTRLQRMISRFARLLARTVDVRRGMRVGGDACDSGEAVISRGQAKMPAVEGVRLPSGFDWLRGMMPDQTAYRSEFNAQADRLATMLADPAMVALIVARPSLRRLLRPLCRAMGIRPAVALGVAGSVRQRVRPDREGAGLRPPSRAEVMREIRYGRPGTVSYFRPRRIRGA